MLRAAFDALVGDHARVHVYVAEPGALAIFNEARKVLEQTGRMGLWMADGWAAAATDGLSPELLLQQALPGDALMLGPQTDFSRTRAMMRQCRKLGLTSIFVLDAWKNHRRHFEGADGVALPDRIGLPDDVALGQLEEEMTGIAMPDVRLVVVGHWGIEASVARIHALGRTEIGPFRARICAPERRLAALLLDPSRRPGEPDIGYDAISILESLPRWLQERKDRPFVAIKPHPRQQISLLDRALAAWPQESYTLFSGELETLIAVADEVWGSTTTALLIGEMCGKPILSFQPGRNIAGKHASNPHIEPFVIEQL